MRGWRPGAYLKQAWATIKAVEELKQAGKRKKVKKRPVLPDTRKTTVHIHRIKGIYHVTMNPVKGPDDKENPEPVVYTLERPEDGSDASEIELDLTVPDPPYPPPPKLKHQAQQFCEEDLPLIQPKQVFIKKKKKKKEKLFLKTAMSKKKKPGSRKSTASTKSVKRRNTKQWAKDGGRANLGARGRRDTAGKGTGGKTPPGKGAPGKGGVSTKGGPPGKAPPSAKGTTGAKEASSSKAATNKQIKPTHTKSTKKGKKKGDDEDDVYPWDEWIMKLKCKNAQSPDD